MVTRLCHFRMRRLGVVTIELVVAIGLLAAVMLPLAYSFVQEQRALRTYYFRAVAMEIIDGEMEVLMAGEWQAFHQGRQEYRVRGEAAQNLPPGEFSLTIEERQLRLEWRADQRNRGGPVHRVGTIPEQPAPRSTE